MALMDAFGSGSSSATVKGYNSTQVVQKAIMEHPMDPMKMFASARCGLSVSNDLFIKTFESVRKHDDESLDLDYYALFKQLGGDGLAPRRLFNRFAVNQNTFITVIYGACEFFGPVLMMVVETPVYVSVTVISASEVQKEANEYMAKVLTSNSTIKAE